MKPGALILINVLLTTGIVVGYDAITDDTPAPSRQEPADAIYIETNDNPEFTPEPQLQGIGFESVLARMDKLEGQFADLKAGKDDSGMVSVDAPSGTSGDRGPMASIDLPIVEEGVDPEFTEDSLRSFQAMLEKVEEERRQQRTIDGLTRQLDRLGVELPDDQRDEVINATMTYREKTRNLWRELPRGTDEESRQQRTDAFTALRDEYSTTIYNIVPSGDAEKIVSGMARGIGFGGRGDTGGRMGGRRGNR